ncbi:hypothetical protein B9Z55_021874 [Caenorhabditis nigoni]|uniref:Uncharacterized protein n=1 Tax=Caenorhabditis nigoni TaxID=1611254 RepID=A0A2G5TTU4_9PELO|nr:hypothetical protein B9Z55_021874 [Caenorhabditis nigoni]
MMTSTGSEVASSEHQEDLETRKRTEDLDVVENDVLVARESSEDSGSLIKDREPSSKEDSPARTSRTTPTSFATSAARTRRPIS